MVTTEYYPKAMEMYKGISYINILVGVVLLPIKTINLLDVRYLSKRHHLIIRGYEGGNIYSSLPTLNLMKGYTNVQLILLLL